MTKRLEMYRCKVCGNLTQVILEGEGELVCCGEPMELLTPNKTENVNTEYHIPVYKYSDKEGLIVQVGKEPHPMTKEHYIQFIETICSSKKHIKLQYLEPEEEPIMRLESSETGKENALAYCNLHGLWEGNND